MIQPRDLTPYYSSRQPNDRRETAGLRDVAFNRHSINDGHHVSPLDNSYVRVGDDGLNVVLVQGLNPEFERVLSMATRATIGIDLSSVGGMEDTRDWEEMLKGGLQTALESQVIVFAVSGASRTATHQIVRTRKAAFHQQSQRASFMGQQPEFRMPESVWNQDEDLRNAWMDALAHAHQAYRMACDRDVSYQDARFILPEGTTNYIMMEYPLREFMNVYAYRGCWMFQWEIVSIMHMCRDLLVERYPYLEPYIKISCETTRGSLDALSVSIQEDHHCTFQGWESVEGQCPFSWARETNRKFRSEHHRIER